MILPCCPFFLYEDRRICKHECIHLSLLKKNIKKYRQANCNYFIFSQLASSELFQRYERITSGETISTLDSCIIDAVEQVDDLLIIILYKSMDDLYTYLSLDMSDKYHPLRTKRCGKLFGYPTCCINQHEKNVINDSVSIDIRWKTELFSEKDYSCPLLSKKLYLYIHRPCSLHCKKTIIMAQKMLTYFAQEFGEEAIPAFFWYVKEGSVKNKVKKTQKNN